MVVRTMFGWDDGGAGVKCRRGRPPVAEGREKPAFCVQKSAIGGGEKNMKKSACRIEVVAV